MHGYLRYAQQPIWLIPFSDLIGGEGKICKIAGRPKESAKIYNDPTPADLEARLEHLRKNPPPTILDQLAWVGDIVEDSRGAVVGYLQPHLSPHYVSLTTIISPLTRPPWGTPAELRRCAYEAAYILAELNCSGFLFPDLHSEQILWAPKKKCYLIDTGSCQFTDGGKLYPCTHVRDEYQPPDLPGQANCADVAPQRDEYSDAWSLTVLIFQLTMSCSPFDGIRIDGGKDIPPQERARQGLFPFHRACREYRPPPDAPLYRDVPAELQDLFFRCFVEGHRREDRTRRPTAAEWADVLRHCRQLRAVSPQVAPATSPSHPNTAASTPLPAAVVSALRRLPDTVCHLPRRVWVPFASLAVLTASAATLHFLPPRAPRYDFPFLNSPSSPVSTQLRSPADRYARSTVDVEEVLVGIRRQIDEEH